MLERYAVLIGSTQGTPPLPMVRDDLILMKNYLKSYPGGGWKDDEIRVYLNRPILDVINGVDRIKRRHPDYPLFYWTGHGFIMDGSQILDSSSEEAIPLAYFFDIADRQLMILDTCRNHVQSDPAIMEASFKQAITPTDRERGLYRRIYDHYVTQCDPSLQIAYACQPGNNAGVSLSGSIYTKSLIRRALRWELPSRHKHGFASIRRLMRKPTSNGAQPDYFHSVKGIKPRCFPFAVGLYR